MPIHDWTRVPAALFHDFQQSWSIRMKDTLNTRELPRGFAGLVERRGGLQSDRANRIVVKHHLGRIVAVIEIVSPGNKDSRAALRDFVDKTIDFLRKGVHVLVIDLFPPTARDPFGIHKVIWDEIDEEDFVFPAGKDRILASYETAGERVAYVEPVAVGDVLPDMPLFLTSELNVKVPLDPTYRATWEVSPEVMRVAVESGIMPEPDAE
jgi:hypothetical protein